MIMKHLAKKYCHHDMLKLADMLKSVEQNTAEALKRLKEAYLDKDIPTVESAESSEKYESLQKEELADLRHIVMILFYDLINKIYIETKNREETQISELEDPNYEENLIDELASVLDEHTYITRTINIKSNVRIWRFKV